MARDRTVGDLNVRLGLNSSNFTSGVRKAKAESAGLEGRLKTLKASAAGLAAGFIGGLSVDMLVQATRAGLDYAASLGEQASKLGVTTRFMQEYRFAVQQNGGTIEAADNALEKLNKRLGEAQNGNKGAVQAFGNLGVAITNADGSARRADQVYADLADAIARIPDPTRQAAAAASVFGKSYREILPLLTQGSQGFNVSAAEARKFGLVLSDEQIQKADQTADKIDAFMQSMQVRIAGVVGDNAEAIGGFVEEIAKMIAEIGEAITALNNFENWWKTRLRTFAAGSPLDRAARSAYGITIENNPRASWEGQAGAFKGKPAPYATPTPQAQMSEAMKAEFIRRNGRGGRGAGGLLGAGGVAALAGLDLNAILAAAEQMVDGVEKQFDRLPQVMVPPFRAARAQIEQDAAGLRADLERETESILQSLFPDEYQADQLRTEMARLDEALAAQLIDPARWFAARTRLAAELKKVQAQIEETESLISEGDLSGMLDKSMEDVSRIVEETLGGTVKKTTAQVVVEFSSMAQGVLYELDSLGRSIKDGDFIGILLGVVGLIQRIASLSGGKSDAASVGSGLSSLIGIGGAMGRLPGFAGGGSFRVGGATGIDSNLVMFRATRGEMVNIATPEQTRRGGAGGLGGGITFDLRYAVTTEQLLGQMNAMVAAGEARAITGGANLAMKSTSFSRGRAL